MTGTRRTVLPLLATFAVLLLAGPGCRTAAATAVAGRATSDASVAPTPPLRPPLGAPGSTPAPAQEDPPELRAVWVDAFHAGFKTPAQVDQLIAWARQANLNTLFVQVRRRGDAYYDASIEPRTEDPEVAPGFDPLRYLIERARQGPQRLQVHAWLATLPVWNQRDTRPADPRHVLNTRGLDVAPEESWLMLRDDGLAWAGDGEAGSYYLDPGNPAAARYTADVALEVLKNYDVDGVHLDQVRYFEGRGLDRRWGYNPASVARFNAAYGRAPGSQPDPGDPDWAAWRRAQVTALVRRIYLQAKAAKPGVVVSAAVVTWGKGPDGAGGWEQSAPFAAVFQDWRAWLQEGILDYAIPMDYYREEMPQAAWLDAWVGWQIGNQGRRAVAIGLGAYLNDAEGVLAQVRRVRSARPLGVALYSYAAPSRAAGDASAPDPQAQAERLREVFARPAPVPELPWQARPTAGNLLVEIPGREAVPVRIDGPTTREWSTDGTGLAGGADLPPGRYVVAAYAPDVDDSPVEIAVTPGWTTSVRFGPGIGAP